MLARIATSQSRLFVSGNGGFRYSSVRQFIKKPAEEVVAETEVKLTRRQRLKTWFKSRPGAVKNYLKMVKEDYSEALKEVTDGARARPVKASIYASILGFCLYANHLNPDELSFKENYISNCQELSQVGDPIRNPASQRLIDYVSRAYNAGLVRRLNLGVCSLMWVDDYDEGLGLYAAQCDYLKPSWADMRHRVVDVGFLGRWWISEKKMEQFDINALEWNEDGSPTNRSNQLKQMW